MRGFVNRLALGLFVVSAVACGSSQSSDKNKDASSDTGAKMDALVAQPDGAAMTYDAHMSDAAATGVDAGGTIADGGAMVLDGGLVDATVATPEVGKADAAAIKLDAPPAIDTVSVDGAVQADGAQAVDGGEADASATPDAAAIADAATGGTCDYPQCLKDLQSGCVPSGSCTMQTDLSTFSTNVCYANGVKFSSGVSLGTLESVTTWKNGASVCYSVGTASASSTSADLTWKNPAGNVVATAHEDLTANTITITCTGATAVTLPLDCNSNSSGGSNADAGTCAQGTCSF
jgi:hypothetical protein